MTIKKSAHVLFRREPAGDLDHCSLVKVVSVLHTCPAIRMVCSYQAINVEQPKKLRNLFMEKEIPINGWDLFGDYGTEVH